MSKNYDNNSMSVQDDRQAIRDYPNVYLGSTDERAVLQTVIEITSNSADEARAGFGNKINITINKDSSIKIEDFGRGLPLDYNDKQKKWNWWIACCKLHGGGKLKGTESRDLYKFSAGQHGIGLSATQLTSKWCKVISKRDGYVYSIEFKDGNPVESNFDKALKKEKDPKGKSQQTGTIIEWLSDDTIFSSLDFDGEELKTFVKAQAICNENITFNLEDKRNSFKESYCYKEGIKSFGEECLQNKNIITPIILEAKGSGKDSPKQSSYEVEAKIYYAFTDNINHNSYYHNSIPLEYGGSPKKAMEIAFTDFFTKQLKAKGTLKKEGLEFDDVGDNLVFISSTFTQEPPAYENQTKKAIKNQFIQDFIVQQITKSLIDWSKNNPLELDKLNQVVAANQEARLFAGSQKALKKEKLSGKIKLSDKIEKLTECDSDDNTITEVYFCEGDSASSIKDARDAKFQAIYALRGKIVNVLKMNINDIINKPILMEVIKVIGTGIQVGDPKANKVGDFNIDNRRFDKYIIASDADIDGDHIASLMLTLFYKLMPELLEKGHVYRLMAPLFVNKLKDGTKKEAYTDAEQEAILKKYGKDIKKTNRYKGLGEWNGEDFEPYMAPATRKLVQYTIEDAKKSAAQIELWMGNDSDLRKAYLAENGDEVANLDFNGSEE